MRAGEIQKSGLADRYTYELKSVLKNIFALLARGSV